ncbi:F-box protein At5g03970-like isoform X1 [Cucurbita pepo subsp. pepo]|uniref:F-box protein At5g03970-like isoform X1 n=1 Tax=Cucurbita pepo subsp. pepo TaxID=3664 RepID=UPI000C9D5301|nr:F-box protein At5g03970-like isoform X1 [Cucurbita pepo subsp. pepo]
MVNAKNSPGWGSASASNRSSGTTTINLPTGHTENLHSLECFPKHKGRKMMKDSIHSALASDDILLEILLRLPEKSVFKFILVSKRWLYLICNFSFRRCYEKQWGAHSRLFGFFVCNFLYIDRPQDGVRRPRYEPALPLLSTCKESDDLMSSGILRKLGYFIDYSDGLLLCGRHPKHYYVWDSVTKYRRQLPQPQKHYKYLCTAFMTEDPSEGRGDIVYRVVRANCECRVDVINTISIETFSSLTWTWKQSTLVCSSEFALSPWTVGTVIKGVIHWFGTYRSLAIYDPGFGERRITSIKLPVGQLTHDYEDSILGESSDRLLQYGQSGKHGLETWVLYKEHDNSLSPFDTRCEYRWKLRCKLSYKELWKQNPNSGIRSKEPQILSFIRRNSDSVFIRLGSNIYQCNIRSKTLEVIPYHCDALSIPWDFCKVVPYFQKIWPHSPLQNPPDIFNPYASFS